MNNNQSNTRNKKRVPELDGIRAIAIILVLAVNLFGGSSYLAGQTNPLLVAANSVIEAGWTGVTLFFVLSGYLIGGILLKNRDSQNYYQVFFLRRSFRIMPIYYVVMSPLFLFPLLNLDRFFPHIANEVLGSDISSAWYALFLQNIAMSWQGNWGNRWAAVTWSLAVEQQFYLLVPFLIRFITPKTLPKILLAIIISAPILRTFFLLWLPSEYAEPSCYTLLPARWDALAMGVLLAWAKLYWRPSDQLSRSLRLPIFATLVVSFIFCLIFSDPFSFPMASIGHTIVASGYTAFIWIVISDHFRPLKFLAHPVICWVGVVSYGVYLMHQMIVSFLFRVVLGQERMIQNFNDILFLLLGAALTFFCAACSWYIMEKRLIKYSHRFVYKTTN